MEIGDWVCLEDVTYEVKNKFCFDVLHKHFETQQNECATGCCFLYPYFQSLIPLYPYTIFLFSKTTQADNLGSCR